VSTQPAGSRHLLTTVDWSGWRRCDNGHEEVAWKGTDPCFDCGSPGWRYHPPAITSQSALIHVSGDLDPTYAAQRSHP
jgi:hypothetical protein